MRWASDDELREMVARVHTQEETKEILAKWTKCFVCGRLANGTNGAYWACWEHWDYTLEQALEMRRDIKI